MSLCPSSSITFLCTEWDNELLNVVTIYTIYIVYTLFSQKTEYGLIKLHSEWSKPEERATEKDAGTKIPRLSTYHHTLPFIRAVSVGDGGICCFLFIWFLWLVLIYTCSTLFIHYCAHILFIPCFILFLFITFCWNHHQPIVRAWSNSDGNRVWESGGRTEVEIRERERFVRYDRGAVGRTLKVEKWLHTSWLKVA